ncbi:MAG: radical SAM protein [Deltaproteobacteria bacterium]|nr:radical SAM protein [Deltaproteobacteria bacterium]
MCSYLQEIETKKEEIKKRRELTSQEIVEIVNCLPSPSNIAFTGGEPFVKKGFMKVLRACKEKRHKVTVGTNGVLLDDETFDEIIRLGVNNVGLSLDGTKEIHNSIRRRDFAYDGLIKAVKGLREKRDKWNGPIPKILVNMVVLPSNYRVLPEVIRTIKEIGADYASIEAVDGSLERSASRLKAHIHPKMSPLKRVPLIMDSDFRTYLEKGFDVARILSIPLEISPPGMTIEDMVKYYRHEFDMDDWRCDIPWTTCRISPYGDLFPCMNYKIGNVKEQSVYQLWSSEKYHVFRQLFKKDRIQPCCIGCCKLTRITPHTYTG